MTTSLLDLIILLTVVFDLLKIGCLTRNFTPIRT